MMSRRTLAGAAAAGVGLLLSACGRRSIDAEVTSAIESVEGVGGTKLESGRTSRFGDAIRGTLSITTGDETAGTEIFDQAMRAAVTTLHDRGQHEIIVGGITGVLENGNELTPLALDPEFPTDDHRLEYVTASSLYHRYGLS